MPKLSERQKRIYDFLCTNSIGVLSSVTVDGDPHGTVIYFCIDKHFNISFLTKIYTRKYVNLQHNNKVLLTVFEPNTQTVAQIIGQSTEVTNSTAVNKVAENVLSISMKTNDADLPPVSKLKAGPYVALKIKPIQIRMVVYSKPDPGDFTELFESIESYDLAT